MNATENNLQCERLRTIFDNIREVSNNTVHLQIKVIFDKSSALVTQLEKRMKQRAQLKKRIKRLKKKERQVSSCHAL